MQSFGDYDVIDLCHHVTDLSHNDGWCSPAEGMHAGSDEKLTDLPQLLLSPLIVMGVNIGKR